MIDLHLHTTASDGQSTPEGLIEEARTAGIHTLAVTDHDTVLALPAAAAAAAQARIGFVAGIEMTAVHDSRDVHVLGYFFHQDDRDLNALLRTQRTDRVRRIRDMAARLTAAGAPVDVEPLLGQVQSQDGRAVGRPALAHALVEAGHARDVSDAFTRYLAEGQPGYVPRQGASPAVVVDVIRRAGGIASLAHPGKTRVDAIIADLAGAGLTAIEVYHPDHSAADTARYLEMAEQLGLLVTGGSDYHGPKTGRAQGLGRIGLPNDAFAALTGRARYPRVL